MHSHNKLLGNVLLHILQNEKVGPKITAKINRVVAALYSVCISFDISQAMLCSVIQMILHNLNLKLKNSFTWALYASCLLAYQKLGLTLKRNIPTSGEFANPPSYVISPGEITVLCSHFSYTLDIQYITCDNVMLNIQISDILNKEKFLRYPVMSSSALCCGVFEH